MPGAASGRRPPERSARPASRSSAPGSERDATDPAQAAALLAEADPDLVVVAASTRPRMVLIDEQSWESFSAPWNVDVKLAFGHYSWREEPGAFVRHAITVLSMRQTEIAEITFFRTAGALTGFDLPERIAPHGPRATGPAG